LFTSSLWPMYDCIIRLHKTKCPIKCVCVYLRCLKCLLEFQFSTTVWSYKQKLAINYLQNFAARIVSGRRKYDHITRAANYCRTSDNVRLNLANVRAKVILIGHWTDHKKNRHTIHFFAVTKSDCKFTQFAFRNKIYEAFCLTLRRNGYTYLSRDLYISCDVYTVYVRPNLVVLVFVRPNSSYVRPKLKVIGQMSCQVKYLFAALHYSSVKRVALASC
jgi:hypothetical protein